MSIADFGLVKALFKGGKLSEEKENELFAELLYMVLTRATAADLNIESVEVQAVIKILKEQLNQDFTEKDIRVAALSDLYNIEPFERCVGKIGRKLTLVHRTSILHALVEVFKSDGGVGVLEAEYFNNVVNALQLTPAQIIGLQK